MSHHFPVNIEQKKWERGGEEKVFMNAMDEIAVVIRHFGDEHSSLLDQYERLSFEVRLNQAILGRSLSEAYAERTQAPLPSQSAASPSPRVAKTRPRSAFNRVMKKLLNPIMVRKGRVKREVQVPDPKDRRSLMAHSRSLRF